MTHVYLGDRWTAPALTGAAVTLPRRPDGKTTRGRNGNMLMETADGFRFVGVGRRLRKAGQVQPVTRQGRRQTIPGCHAGAAGHTEEYHERRGTERNETR